MAGINSTPLVAGVPQCLVCRAMSEDGALVLEDEARNAVIQALLIGLESFGEIERIFNACDIAQMRGEHVPKEVKPSHPTGSADTIGVFATALRYMHQSCKETCHA